MMLEVEGNGQSHHMDDVRGMATHAYPSYG